jgi:dTDP-4-amino-4,6-dideoxy-D-galactose acyltransferase
MGATEVCRRLDWDSDFFGLRIGRLIPNLLTPETLSEAVTWCAAQGIDCLYFLADPADADTVRLAESNGFRLVDIRVTLENQLNNHRDTSTEIPNILIRHCVLEDVPALRAIARTCHRDSRFYYDANFPKSLCDYLYETWIEKSCHGYAQAVFVAELHKQPVGYITCHLVGEGEGQIGLFGVSSDAQGSGLGCTLLNEALRWFAGQGRRRIMVVTQGRNCRAQRLYQRSGFVTRSVELWYHRWFSESVK